MPFIPLIILLFFIFAGLMFFLRYFLTRNITKATGHLEELSKEYTIKQEEINRRLKEAAEEAKNIVFKAKEEAEEAKSAAIKEAHAYKDQVINETRQKTEDMIAQAEKTCEALKQEIHQRIEQGALEKACELIKNALPEEFRIQLHTLWMEEAQKGEFNVGKLNLSGKIDEAQVVSAFPLSEKQKQMLHEKLTQKFGDHIQIKKETDPELIAGLVITVGNVIIDGSFRDKIQKLIKSKS